MAHHQKLRTDDFDDRGRNQYDHHDNAQDGRQGDTYEQRNYGNSRSSEGSRPTYASSGRHTGYGQHDGSGTADPRSRQGGQHDEDRGYRGDEGNRARGYNSGPQGGGYEYYQRDNSQFRSYYDESDRREYPAREDRDAPSYIHYSHQRPGGITPRDYDPREARVRGHEASRGRDQYSRGPADRGTDRYFEDYRDDATDRINRQEADRDDNRREPRATYDGSNRDGRRSDYGYGDDYSSSLYDANSRNSAFRRDDDQDRGRSNDRNRDDYNDRNNQRRR